MSTKSLAQGSNQEDSEHGDRIGVDALVCPSLFRRVHVHVRSIQALRLAIFAQPSRPLQLRAPTREENLNRKERQACREEREERFVPGLRDLAPYAPCPLWLRFSCHLVPQVRVRSWDANLGRAMSLRSNTRNRALLQACRKARSAPLGAAEFVPKNLVEPPNRTISPHLPQSAPNIVSPIVSQSPPQISGRRILPLASSCANPSCLAKIKYR
jgi:hypothetical protein